MHKIIKCNDKSFAESIAKANNGTVTEETDLMGIVWYVVEWEE